MSVGGVGSRYAEDARVFSRTGRKPSIKEK